jgi:hypothetical protein
MTYIDARRIATARPVPRTADEPTPERRDRTRASLALTAAWVALAVVFGAYAIAHAGIGAAIIGLVVLGAVRLAWHGAWQEDSEPRRDITLLP